MSTTIRFLFTKVREISLYLHSDMYFKSLFPYQDLTKITHTSTHPETPLNTNTKQRPSF